jgi:hypothetical protein
MNEKDGFFRVSNSEINCLNKCIDDAMNTENVDTRSIALDYDWGNAIEDISSIVDNN